MYNQWLCIIWFGTKYSAQIRCPSWHNLRHHYYSLLMKLKHIPKKTIVHRCQQTRAPWMYFPHIGWGVIWHSVQLLFLLVIVLALDAKLLVSFLQWRRKCMAAFNFCKQLMLTFQGETSMALLFIFVRIFDQHDDFCVTDNGIFPNCPLTMVNVLIIYQWWYILILNWHWTSNENMHIGCKFSRHAIFFTCKKNTAKHGL